MAKHEKSEKPLSEGRPPPGNSDGQVPTPPAPTGKRRKDDD